MSLRSQPIVRRQARTRPAAGGPASGALGESWVLEEAVPLTLYLGIVGATVVLILIPGPNMSLIVAYGTRYGLLTLAGTAGAMMGLALAHRR